MKMLGTDDVFNIKTWEDLQIAVAQLLGMSIRITDESGKVSTSYDSFEGICAVINKNKQLCEECEKFRPGIPVVAEEPSVCAGRICHYTVISEFFYKNYYITVSSLCYEQDDDFINKTAADAGIEPADLGFLYASLPNYNPEKLKSWARLIGNMFTKVMEPALQTNIMYMAEKEKEEEINKLKLLMRSNITINSTKLLPKLLSIISDSAEKLVQAELCLIYFVDYEKNELYFEWTFSGRDKLTRNQRIKLGESVLGIAAQTGVSQIVNDILKEPRYTAAEDIPDIKTSNFICVPIKTSSGAIAVMKIVNRAEGQPFTAHDQVFLEALASQAAIAIENAIIYENMEGASFKLNHQLEKSNLNLSIEKKRMESVIKSLEDAVIAIDRNRLIVLINRGAEKLFNIKAKKAFSAPIESYMRNQEMLHGITNAMDKLENKKMEFILPILDEDHIFAAVFAPIIDDEQACAGAVAVFRDITETKRLENLKTEFLNMVAHELRTPLTPIIAYIQLILIRDPPPEKVKKYASLIFRETQRLSTLINDLLDLSRIESGKGLTLNIEPINLREVAGNVYETFKDASPKHTMVFESPDSLTANADKDKMTQVLINLLSNAVKYSPNGGEIKIRLFEERNNTCVSVIDHGIGIPKDDLTKVFDKFHRVDNKQVHKIQGTGIGLTIVKKIMDYHKGGIKVESKEGAGSTFTFWMPKS
jgi:two-component system, OmpR family, phosphate regulon sensor histidine kinase PhoR